MGKQRKVIRLLQSVKIVAILAAMLELVDKTDLKSVEHLLVWVRVPLVVQLIELLTIKMIEL